jgi:hypothetical protein
MDDILLGLVQAPTEVVDHFFSVGLTNHMFETNSTAKDGLDLVACECMVFRPVPLTL